MFWGKKSKYFFCFTEKVCQVCNYPCNWNRCSCSRICQINLTLQFLILSFESGISKGFHAQFLHYLTSSFKIVLDMVVPMSKEWFILWNIENKESSHSEKCRWHIWQHLHSISQSISSDEWQKERNLLQVLRDETTESNKTAGISRDNWFRLSDC